MNQKILHKIFIWGFLFLYFLVALISFCHAVQFFGIGNVKWMSIALAFSFELGLALSLASILLSNENKKQTLPWILMSTLTAVQVIGNVYSVFRYISLSEQDYYQYLAKPILFFIEEVDAGSIQVIVSWIMGAILPIVALMMTDMVANNIKNASDDKKELPEESTKPIEEQKEKMEEPVFEKESVPAFNTPKETNLEEEPKIEAPVEEPKIEAPVSVDLDKVKEDIKESSKEKEDEDNIANYLDVLTPSENKSTSEKDETKRASILNFLPGKLFNKKKEASKGYFRDPVVNRNDEKREE